jgi:hypothetical protein
MKPEQIIFIRHGEKTEMKDGKMVVEPIHLSTQGKQRAQGYIEYFEQNHASSVHVPDLIYAMKQKNRSSSDRCHETVLPLATRFKLPITMKYTRDEIKKVVKDINKSGKDKIVLVCWEHDALVDIAKGFGAPVKVWGLHPMCEEQKDNYNAMWVLTRDGQNTTFEVFATFDIDEHGQPCYNHITNSPLLARSLPRGISTARCTRWSSILRKLLWPWNCNSVKNARGK